MYWILLSMLGLGITSAVMPCPLAGNIAAVSYLTRQVHSPLAATISALLYTLGRIGAYAGIALILGLGLSSVPSLSYTLQTEMPLYMGPLLCIAGLVLLGIIPFPSFGKKSGGFEKQSSGFIGTCLSSLGMGFLFALALCPPSAAILFLTVLPKAVQMDTFGFGMSIVSFGIGTALPVVVIALILVFSVRHAQIIMRSITKAQSTITMITGIILLAIGVYFIFDKILLA